MSAAQNLAVGMPIPGTSTSATTLPSYSSLSCTSATIKLGWIVCLKTTDPITRLGLRYNSRTGTPPRYRISLQGVVDGLPDGTVLGGASPCSATFTPPADTTWNATLQWITLDHAYTPAGYGEYVAIVIEYSSGTVNGSNYSSIGYASALGPIANEFPYPVADAGGGGGWAPAASSLRAVYAYGTATTVYGNPMANTVATAFASDSTPDEYGLSFILPTWLCYRATVRGVRWHLGKTELSARNLTMTLYDGTTPLQTVTRSSTAVRATATAGCRTMEMTFTDAVLATLTAGTRYYVALTTNGVGSPTLAVLCLQTTAAGDMDAYAMGQDWQLCTRVDAGAWTLVPTSRPMAELILETMTPPVVPAASDVRVGVLVGYGSTGTYGPTCEVMQRLDKFRRGLMWRMWWGWIAGEDGIALSDWLDPGTWPPGTLVRLTTQPSPTIAPTAPYTVALETPDGLDLLGGRGAGRSTANPEAVPLYSTATDIAGIRLPRSTPVRLRVSTPGAWTAGECCLYGLRAETSDT
jgi:hypothetical protein